MTESQHFQLGTFVKHKNKRYEVIDIFGDLMITKDEDGNTREFYPFALLRTNDVTVEEATPVTVEPKKANSAPDWGRRYGLTELWTEVQEGLWVGGTDDADTVDAGRESRLTWMGGFDVTEDAWIGPEDFDAVVTLYAWARPVDWLVEEYRWGIYDGGEVKPDIETIRDVVVWAHKRWRSDKKVLLRCQAGLSRSTFFTALVLVRDGMEVQEAVDLIRKKRSSYCLNVNGSAEGGSFTHILKTTPVEFWRD